MPNMCSQSRILQGAILAVVVGFLAVGTADLRAAEWYAAPTGTPGGNGGINNPWDLQTALDHPASVQPGDTIWKLARMYRTTTKLIMDLNGITDAKTIRAGDTIQIPKPAGE